MTRPPPPSRFLPFTGFWGHRRQVLQVGEVFGAPTPPLIDFQIFKGDERDAHTVPNHHVAPGIARFELDRGCIRQDVYADRLASEDEQGTLLLKLAWAYRGGGQ